MTTHTKPLSEAFPEMMKNVGDILLLAKLLTPEDPAIAELEKLLERARAALHSRDTVDMVALYYLMEEVVQSVNVLAAGFHSEPTL